MNGRKFNQLAMLLVAFLMWVAPLSAQQEVRLGQHRFVPEQNVKLRVRSRAQLQVPLGEAVNGRHNVLVQFSTPLETAQRAKLEKEGVTLGDYLGGNAYFATVKEGVSPSAVQRTRLTSIIPIRGEWKMMPALENWEIPQYAKVGADVARVQLLHFPNVTTAWAASELSKLGIKNVEAVEYFSLLTIDLPKSKLRAVADLPWVASLTLIPAPQELYNADGRTMGKGNLLSLPGAMGGSGLTGAGVKVGVWDGNVTPHFDYAARLHQQEFEMTIKETQGHGMHVVGSIAGAGLLDPKMQGVAPNAEIYAYNFNRQSNGLNEQAEMVDALNDYGVFLSSHSYGPQLQRLCAHVNEAGYNLLVNDYLIDLLASLVPTVTQVYAAGNDQGACGRKYGTVLRRSKNVIYVGALDAEGRMTDFSSCGPQDDGRVVPTISIKGDSVKSTLPNDTYGYMSGTSMATPLVSGHLALITERYHQLHSGRQPESALLRALIIASADDVNEPGPDYGYGYGVLNAEAALGALEKGHYRKGVLKQGDAPQTFTVVAPQNAKRAWVALAWTDTVSNAIVPYGEPVLINDLNLTVDNGGTSYLPWVLDKADPKVAPVRKEDNINNAELISIDNPRGELTISVSPKHVASKQQSFYVVWHFDVETPQITYPIGGELLEPGERVVIQAANMQSPVRAELSYDNGKTYRPLTVFEGNYGLCVIPHDAPFTAEALVRLSDGQGKVVRSPNPFTIMPAPKNVRVEKVEEGASSVLLTWAPIEGVKEYEVLYTTENQAHFTSIAKSKSYKFLVPEKHLGSQGRYAFAVKAISESGVVSQRSAAALSTEVAQRNANSVEIPFCEEFRVKPSPDVFVENGECMVSTYEEAPANLKLSPGAHVLAVVHIIGLLDDTWDDEKPFDTEKSYTRIGFHHLDLTKETGRVFLEVAGMLVRDKEIPQLRLEVDGTPIKDVNGRAEFVGTDEVQYWVWELTDYKSRPVEVALRTVAESSKAGLILLYIKVRREVTQPDLELMNFAGVYRVGAYGERTPVYSYVRNHSSCNIESAPIHAFANGRPVGSVLVKDIKPYETRKVEYTLDLSTEKPEGELLEMELRVSAAGDENLTNNVQKGNLFNSGEKYIMDCGYLESGIYFGTSDEIVVKGSRLIAEDGGYAFGYKGQRDELLLLKPSNPNRVLAVTVQKASLLGARDELYINSPMGNSSKTMNGTRNLAIIHGELEHPVTYLSTANDGGIVLKFMAGRNGKGDGWQILATEVDRKNTLKLEKVDIIKVPDSDKLSVKATVKNVSDERQTNVSVSMNQGLQPHRAKNVASETIQSIEAGASVEHTFEYQPTVVLPSYDSIRVYIDGYDTEFSDNISSHFVLNDHYCEAPQTADGDERLRSATLFDKTVSVMRFAGRVPFNTHDTLTAYRAAKSNELQVAMRGVSDGLALGVWIDWNDDKNFGTADAGEYFTVDVNAGDKLATIPLSVPTDAVPGAKRMRVLLAEKASLAACGATLLPRSDGGDFIVRLMDADFPAAGDVALTLLTANRVGALLAEEEEIKVEFTNPSDVRVETLKVAYSIDGATPVVETVTCDLKPFDGTAEYTFTQKANLAAHGKHSIKAWIASSNANFSNDTLSLTVHSLTPENEGTDYYLHFKEDTIQSEMLVFSDLASEISGSNFSFDFMLRLDHAQFAPIMQAKDFIMIACNEGSGFPENSILFAYQGLNKVFLSPAGTLKPGRWQHITVDHTLYNPVITRLYVDGVAVDLMTAGDEGTSKMKNFKAMYLFEGSIDNLRFWKDYIDEVNARKLPFCPTNKLPGHISKKLIAEFKMNEGPSNTALLAFNKDGSPLKKHYALIESERTGAGDNSIWQTERGVIADIHFENQVGPLDTIARKHYRVTLTAATDLSKAVGIVHPQFAFGRVFYNGVEVKENMPFDFSSGAITLYGVVVDYYGENLFDTVTISAVKEPSAACELLSLQVKADENPGLEADYTLQPVPSTFLLEAPADYKGENFKFSFTLSEGAVAYFKGQPIESPATLSLSEPIALRVLAANKRTEALYTIALAKKNAIEWPLAQKQIFYGDSIAALPASSDAGLPLAFASDKPNVITYTGQSFKAIGVGNATLIARQQGNGQYAAADPVQHVVEVLPRQATIAPRDREIAYGTMPGEVELFYADLLPIDDTLIAPLPSYSIIKDNAPWDPASGLLEPGVYAVKPESVEPYRAENYLISPLEGKLTVRASSAVELTLSVVDASGTPIDGAAITIDGTSRGLSAATPLKVNLLAGRHGYSVTKEGYAVATDTVVLTDAPITEKVVLAKRTFELVYKVDGNGKLEGYTEQLVARGEDGTPVMAIPDKGYFFEKWDDGVTTPTRMERDVQDKVTATAQFKRLTHTVSYVATMGGSITGGSATQQVNHNEDAQSVTATPDADCDFIEWSDGSKEATRQEKNVENDAAFTAIFSRTVNLPYKQNFETSNALPAFMYNEETGRARGATWHVTTEAVKGQALDGRFLAIKNPELGDEMKIELFTPKFAVGNVGGDITVEFDYIFFGVLRTKVEVYYSVDGGSLERLGTLDKDPECKKTRFSKTIENSTFAGKEYIQLSFYYYGPTHELVCIDNLAVTPASVSGTVQLNYYATTGGKVNNKTHINITTTEGTEGDQVTATADAGWKFSKWSDGVEESQRKDSRATTVEALFVPASAGASFYTISYSADEHGSIAGVRRQTGLRAGEQGTPVTAVPNAEGYHFVKWSDGRTDNPRIDEVVSQDISVSAVFSNRFTLSYLVEPADGGSIVGEATQEVAPGGDATLVKAEPKSDYHFVKWSDGLLTAERTDVDVQASAALTAIFAKEYTLEYAASEGGTIEGDVKQNVQPGASGTLVKAIPFAGYAFKEWSDGGANAERTDKGEKELSVTAQFEPIKLSVSYTAAAGGTLQGGEATQSVSYGANSEPVKAVPDEGFHFVKWSDGRRDNPRYERAVIANVEAEAIFSKEYTLTYTVAAGGTLEGPATQTVAHGADAKPITAVPDPGYHFVGWSDGVKANPRTDSRVIANITAEARFSNAYTVTYIATDGGTIEGDAQQMVAEGADATAVEAKPNPGYRFKGWSDGADQAARQDKAVNADATYTALFELKKYTLTVEVLDGKYTVGLPAFDFIYAEPEQPTYEVEHGALSQHVNLKFAPGVKFEKWEDGSKELPRFFTLDGDKTVKAIVKIPKVDLYVEYNGLPIGPFAISNPWTGKIYEAHQEVELGACVMVNYVPDKVPRGEQLFIEFEGLRKVNFNYTPEPNATFYQVVDGTKPARISISVRKPRYVVTYKATEGGMLVGNPEQEVSVGGSSMPVEAIALLGYYFAGWSDGQTNPKRVDLITDSPVEVTAIFKRVAYEVVFLANGGEGTMQPQAMLYGETASLTPNAFTHPYATFKGWAKTPEATEGVYTDGQEVKNLTLDNGAKVFLYAVWDVPQYELKFEVAKGSENRGTLVATVAGQPVTSGAQLPAGSEVYLQVKPNDGFVVDAWSGVSASPSNSSVVSLTIAADADITVSFKFIEKKEEKKTAVESQLLAAVEATPNPFSTSVTITEAYNVVRVTLLTVEGHVVLSKAHDGSERLHVSTETLSAGVYLLRCEDVEGAFRTLRVVKQ